jgi:hypothetical protein
MAMPIGTPVRIARPTHADDRHVLDVRADRGQVVQMNVSVSTTSPCVALPAA